jgi:hypothetical protein
MSVEEFPMVFEGTYLRLKVLEQNLQLYGRSPESVMPISESCEVSEKDTKTSGSAREGRKLTLLLVPQQMGLALELLATLIAG